MLLTIAIILIAVWVIGLLVHIGGAIIHVVLILAVIAAVMHFLRRNRSEV